MTTYNTPATAIASSKQIWAVSNKFTSMFIEANEIPRVKWKIVAKRVFATLMHTNPEGITHGKIQEYFGATKLPSVIVGLVKIDDLTGTPAKAAKAPAKAAPKAKTAPKAAKAAQKPAKAAQKPAKAVDQGTEARLTFLEETAILQMKKIESIEDGLAQILLAVRG